MKKKVNHFLCLVLTLSISVLSYAQEKVIKGKVSDESGLPIPGASLLIKGTTKGNTTDMEGNYSISAKSGDIIIFSYLGYTSIEQKVGSASTYNISLQPSKSELEEVLCSVGVVASPYAC